jgi:hypothetical protein
LSNKKKLGIPWHQRVADGWNRFTLLATLVLTGLPLKSALPPRVDRRQAKVVL